MSIQVRPLDLKVIAKLSGQVKDIMSNTKRYSWSSLHRLVAKDGWYIFYTNDGQVFLEWVISPQSSTNDDYEIAVPAAQFNELASKPLVGSFYQISYEDGFLELSQAQRKLKIRTEPLHDYPDPTSVRASDPCWLITAALLNKNLRFVAPFIGDGNVKTSLRVATWKKNGDLIGGTLQLMVRVQGLPVPLVPMSFTQRSAKALGAFLGALTGDVQITVSEKHYYFECPTHHHRLIIARETASFREPDACGGSETEIVKVDGPRLLSGVLALEPLLPKDAYRLLFEVYGSGENAVVKISTGLEDSKSSQDEVPAIRELNGTTSTWFSVNNKFLAQALREMDGVNLTLKYYHKDKLLYIEDDRCSDTDTRRVTMLVVHSVASLREKES